MEEVLEKLGSALITSKTPPETSKTDYEYLYKNWGKLGNQEERRKEQLDIQKNNRNSKLDKLRGILELVNTVEENDIFHCGYKKSRYRPNIYVAGFNKVRVTYKNVLMLSEWMVERPDDFHEEWYVSPCPKGVRVMVIANRGKTKCFTKYGSFRFETHTLLPGGSPYDEISKRMKCCCVLDCFYHEPDMTFYVLDLLAWNNQPMTDCDTEFRNYWLQSQFDEMPQLGVINKKNKVRFILLPKVPCTPEKLNEFMMTCPPFENYSPECDGLLFYHKKAHYISGQTPLVGWLYPYMVQEVLGADITVNPAYLEEKPANYVDQSTFIKIFEEKLAKKNNRYKKSSINNNNMDTSNVTESEDQMEANSTQGVEMEAEELPLESAVESNAEKTSQKKDVENTIENPKDPKLDRVQNTIENVTESADMEAEELLQKTITKILTDS